MRYSKAFQNHFMNPSNVGEIEDACGQGEAVQEKDGDHVSVFVKLEGDRVTMRYLVKGCPRIIASSSALSVLVNGKTIDEALAVGEEAVREELDFLDPGFQCPGVPILALRRAVEMCRKDDGR